MECVQKANDNNEWQSLFPEIKAVYQVLNIQWLNLKVPQRKNQTREKTGRHIKTDYSSMYVLKKIGFNMVTLEITDCKKETDYVIVIIHGGVEHHQLPSMRMKKLYRYFVDCGADAVVKLPSTLF